MKQFNMCSQVINWDSEIFNNKKVVTPPRFWFLNDLVYIHLCDLTWATPRIFCWQDDRRSRSDQVAKDKLIQFNVYFSVNFADESSQLSIISFMHWLSQSSRISSLTQTSRFSAADELSQSKMNNQPTGINYLSQIPGTAMIGPNRPKSCNNNFFHIYDSDNCVNLTKYL